MAGDSTDGRGPAQSFLGIEAGGKGRLVAVQASCKSKLDRHLVPWLWALAVLCYLDRSNLSYAAVALTRDLSLSCATYGLGAGVFFVSYALFQLPANMVMVRVGAPAFLAAIAAAWGAVAMAFSLAAGRTSFLLLRFALGLAECGAFPAFFFHLSSFYSERELGPAYSKVATSTALAQVLGGPLAAALLSMDGLLGLQGWRWLFLVEGAWTIGFAGLLYQYLPRSPAAAAFLSPEERTWLEARQEAAAVEKGAGAKDKDKRQQCRSLVGILTDWRVVYLALTWMCIAASMFGLVFWIPLLLSTVLNADAGGHGGKACGSGGGGGGGGSSSSGSSSPAAEAAAAPAAHSPVVVALLSAVPFVAAAAAMLWNAKRAEAANERHRHAGVPVVLAGCALGLVPTLLRHAGPASAFMALVVAVGAAWAMHGPFFSWPAVFLHGQDAAAAFAFINSCGAVGGFIGPSLIGVLSGTEAGFGLAMRVLAATLLAAGLALLCEEEGMLGPHGGPPPAHTQPSPCCPPPAVFPASGRRQTEGGKRDTI